MITKKQISNDIYPIQSSRDMINQYLACYDDVDEVKRIMQDLIDTAISSPLADSWSADERADMIFFCKQMSQLAEVVMKIYKE